MLLRSRLTAQLRRDATASVNQQQWVVQPRVTQKGLGHEVVLTNGQTHQGAAGQANPSHTWDYRRCDDGAGCMARYRVAQLPRKSGVRLQPPGANDTGGQVEMQAIQQIWSGTLT